MSFNRSSQPLTQDTGKLAISCCKVLVNGTSAGAVSDVKFSMDGETRDIVAGYPLRPIQQVLASQSAKATAVLEELGGVAKTLLTAIISSLNTSVVPTYNLNFEVFRPLDTNILIAMSNAALLQEFELDFGYDFNSLGLNFEQLVPTGQTLDSVVSFTEALPVTYAADSPLINSGHLSMGLPKVTVGGFTLGAVKTVRLVLATDYARYESGFPRNLFKLKPLSHSVILEVEAEEVSSSLLSEDFSLVGPASVALAIALYNGTTMSLTLPEAILSPAGGIGLNQTDFATKIKRFTSTGSTLLTIT